MRRGANCVRLSPLLLSPALLAVEQRERRRPVCNV